MLGAFALLIVQSQDALMPVEILVIDLRGYLLQVFAHIWDVSQLAKLAILEVGSVPAMGLTTTSLAGPERDLLL